LRTNSRFLLALALTGSTACLLAQPATQLSPDRWEEINFAFNSDVLVDGFPSLLRLADLLAQNARYKATLSGYTDSVGPDAANRLLSRTRAEAVRKFLVSHGARPEQLIVQAFGPSTPEASNDTREGRFINRRVGIVVTDEKGREIGAGSLGSRLRPIDYSPPPARPSPKLSRSCFAVQTGTYRQRPVAEYQAALLRQHSWPVRLRAWEADPSLWRVLVGCEPDRETAERILEPLRLFSASAFVVRIPGL
jgi:hypothetical protein